MEMWIENKGAYLRTRLFGLNTDPRKPFKCYCLGCGDEIKWNKKDLITLPYTNENIDQNLLYLGKEYVPLRIYQSAHKGDDGKYRICLCKKCLKTFGGYEEWIKDFKSRITE